MPLDPCLRPGDRQRARRLEHRSRVFEHVLQRRARCVGVDEHDVVHVLPDEPKGLLAHLFHCDAVGEKPDVGELHAPARGKRARHGVGVLRLHADHLDFGAHTLHVRGDPADQASAADRDEDRVDRPLPLAQDLHSDRSLARDHVRVVVRMDECRPRALLQQERTRVRVAVRVAVQHDRRAAGLHRGDLDVRSGHRHHDRRGAAEPLRRERDALRMVARRRGDDAARALGRREMRHLVVRAAQLEREHRLLVLALEKDAVAEPSRQRRREIERRFDRHVVNLRGQDLLQVIDGHDQTANGGTNAACERSRKARATRAPRCGATRRTRPNQAAIASAIGSSRSQTQRPLVSV